MTARSHERGWPIHLESPKWVYSDTGEEITDRRACKRCGREPDSQGRDACLGHIEGATAACCGHGATQPYVVDSTGQRRPLIIAQHREVPNA